MKQQERCTVTCGFGFLVVWTLGIREDLRRSVMMALWSYGGRLNAAFSSSAIIQP